MTASASVPLFFTCLPKKAIAPAGLHRPRDGAHGRTAHKEGRHSDSGDDVGEPQVKTIIRWCASKGRGEATLRATAQPTLIVHGSDDTMFPSINAYNMFKAMTNADLPTPVTARCSNIPRGSPTIAEPSRASERKRQMRDLQQQVIEVHGGLKLD